MDKRMERRRRNGRILGFVTMVAVATVTLLAILGLL
jgi:hypothetical protein